MRNHYKYDGTAWTSVSTLPYPFYNGSAVVYNNEIHILGSEYRDGTISSGTYYYYKHYKWNGTTWTEVSTLPYPFTKGSVIVYNNAIHLLGSSTSKKEDSNNYMQYHYKWDGSSWTEVSTLPYNFYSGGATVYNNEIHLLGSLYSDSCSKYHCKWDGSTWTSVSTLPYNFHSSSVVVYNEYIHILGTASFSSNITSYYSDRHYKYGNSSYERCDNMPYEFQGSSAVVFNNYIHLLGSSVEGERTKHYIIEKESFKKV